MVFSSSHDIIQALNIDRFSLQILATFAIDFNSLKIQNPIHDVCHELELPLTSDLLTLRKYYNRKYYSCVSNQYLSSYRCFIKAAQYGDIPTFNSLLPQIKDVTLAARGAGRGNQLNLLNRILEINPLARYYGLLGAIEGGHEELFYHLYHQEYIDDEMIDLSIKSKKEELLSFLLSRSQPDVLNRSRLKIAGIEGKYLSIEDPIYWEYLARGNHKNILDQVLPVNIHPCDRRLEGMLIGAMTEGNVELVMKYYDPELQSIYEWAFEKSILFLVLKNRVDVIETLLKICCNSFILNNGLIGAIRDNNLELIQYFYDRGANGWEEAIGEASKNEDTKELIPIFEDLNSCNSFKNVFSSSDRFLL